MSVETLISLADQLPVEPFFAAARFISSNQEDGLALGVESKGHSPFTVGRAEPQFLHICVTRAHQGINAGPAQIAEKEGQRQNLCPHVFLQRDELRLKLVADLNNPAPFII